jgi:hypothetical protein
MFPKCNTTFKQQVATIRYVLTEPLIPALDIWNASYTQGLHLEFNAGSAPGIFTTPGIYAINPTLIDPGYAMSGRLLQTRRSIPASSVKGP